MRFGLLGEQSPGVLLEPGRRGGGEQSRGSGRTGVGRERVGA